MKDAAIEGAGAIANQSIGVTGVGGMLPGFSEGEG